jgi:hypothetical protein
MKKIIVLGFVLSIPTFAFADAASGGTTIGDIMGTIIGYINYIVPVLVTIAVIYFVWGIITFMTSNDEEAKKMARTKIINGLIGLFIIVCFWGLVAILQRSFKVDRGLGGNVVPCTPMFNEATQSWVAC